MATASSVALYSAVSACFVAGVSASYREYQPPRELKGFVDCVWTVRRQPGSTLVNRVVPDGCGDVIFNLLPFAPAGQRVLHVGTMTRAIVTSSEPQNLIGVRFRPGSAAALLRLPAAESVDRIMDAEPLWTNSETLRDQLSTVMPEQAARLLFDTLLSRYELVSNIPTALPVADRMLRESAGRLSVSDLGRRLGLSPRFLQRLFLRHTGVSPKFIARTYRLRSALAALERGSGTIAAIAVDYGYFDQSHLTRDMTDLAGMTPTAFREERRVAFVQDERSRN